MGEREADREQVAVASAAAIADAGVGSGVTSIAGATATGRSDVGCAPRLMGRGSECEALDRLLAAVRAGVSKTLVLRGEPGVGKTALMEYLAEHASDCRLARVAGVQAEMELAFAGLHQLLASMLDRVDRLPAGQRDSLKTAFGLSEASPSNHFLVGLAALSLLSDVAEERPLVCLVDDAQWLDRASGQVLSFVARRLEAESVALVVAIREPNEEETFDRLPELTVPGLRDEDARGLLTSVIKGRVDEQVLDRIVAESRGNPLALLELPRCFSAGELAGGFGVSRAVSVSARVERSYLKRVRELPDDAQRLLLLAAAEPVGDAALLLRAAKRVGLGGEAAAPAQAAGLVELGTHVRFCHPLVRSAVYEAASLPERQAAHRALGEATDAEVDPDRRAWHLAQAASGTDEDLAAELERSAGRAQARGGIAAAAAFLERATALTADRDRRATRALAAAKSRYEAGGLDEALELLAIADTTNDRLEIARVDLLRAQIAFASQPGRGVPPLLLKVAGDLEAVDVDLSRETYLEALVATTIAGRLASGPSVVEISEAVLAGPRSPDPARPSDLLLEGFAIRYTKGHAAAAPLMREAVDAFRYQTGLPAREMRWLWLASWVAVELWDDETWTLLCARQLEYAREAAALTAIPLVVEARCINHALCGELAAAESLVDEMRAANEAMESQWSPYGELWLATLRGREPELSALIESTVNRAKARGEGLALTTTELHRAMLHNSLGRHEVARDAASRVFEAGDYPNLTQQLAVSELAEAASRTGDLALVESALRRLTELTGVASSDWARGFEARIRAFLSHGDDAEEQYRESVATLGRTRLRVESARAHLLFGEWLRRERRRIDAREHLRAAHEMFSAMGVEGFAERARRELLASGETVRRRAPETRDDLTARELQIARLARDGLSNPEIGTRLYISPRTVQYHLSKVFNKLDIGSRNELEWVLPGDPTNLPPRR